ncbi:hypothetical protein IQ244_03655 [Nostoc sp. LEGE 06077]|uniref:hypothetical protein n=1 Tax=Nostoc sp. LEGE 06077 TaxID=915325 RepID=UPI0018809B1A|nr:hypothetical protein [Nostoc sp. LEGE 06077]MBE9205618.1 hypothetical protein [Nostoc sp. LEGE 06077]
MLKHRKILHGGLSGDATQAMDVLAQLLYLLRLVINLIYQISYLWELLKHLFKPRVPFGFSVSKPQHQPRRNQRYSRSYRTDPKNRELQRKLLEMLRGDTATAKRLLKHQRQLHKGKSDNWYLEKVIYDLERDRH